MNTKPLGRRHAPDPRDAQYPITVALKPTATLPTYKYWSGSRVHLNQTGDTCVANAWTHLLTDSPHSHRLIDIDADAPGWALTAPDGTSITWSPDYVSGQSGERGFRGKLYDWAQQTDEFDDTPPAGGTSVRAGAKILQRIGAVSTYRWAFTIQDVIAAVLTLSPVIVGTNWYEGMFTPTGSKYLLEPTGGIAGGHAYKIDGYNQTTQLFRMKNSWGTEWGDNGYAHITRSTLDQLLFGENGEACIPTET